MSAILKEVWDRYRLPVALVFFVLLFLLFVCAAGKEKKTEMPKMTGGMQNYITEKTVYDTVKFFLPLFAFVDEGRYADIKEELLYENVLAFLPFYQFGLAHQNLETESEDRNTFALLLEAESRDEETRLEETISEEGFGPGEETAAELLTPKEPENGSAEMSLEEMMFMENENAAGVTQKMPEFVKHEKQFQYDWTALQELDVLKSTFYAFSENTALGSDFLNMEILQKDLSIDKTAEGPQILIYHTHSQEAFADSVPGDVSMTIQGVGEHLAQILREEYGYEVLHHTGQYDVQTRDNAYSRALPEIEQILSDNPSIQVVIDLHRDSANPSRSMVVDVDGRPTARFMFFNGISRTKKNGEIAYLHNPNLEDNLAFSFQMQVKAGEYYPGLTRKIYVREYRYNMHVKPRTLLIELGDNSNTLQEAMNACDPIAHILDMVLSSEE